MSEERIVYPLSHEYESDDGELVVKDLGTYSTREKAQEAIERYRILPGFRDEPDAFRILRSILDLDAAWTDGYINGDEAEKPLN